MKKLGRVELLWAMGHLAGFSTLSSISSSVLGPAVSYLLLNYYARKYTDLSFQDIHCELNATRSYCQSAAIDVSRTGNILAAIEPAAQLLILPVVGALSDVYGRRPTLLIGYGLSQIPLYIVTVYIFTGVGMILALVTSYIFQSSYWYTVLSSATNDRLAGTNRASALALLAVVQMPLAIAANILGVHIPMRWCLVFGSVSVTLVFVYLLLYYPETLPRRARKELNLAELMPSYTFNILVRNPLLRRITLVVVLTGILDTGMAAAVPMFLVKTLGWNRTDALYANIVGAFAGLFWLGVMFPIFARSFGEIGCLVIARVVTTVGIAALLCVHKASLVIVVFGLLSGPNDFTMPAAGALKSRLVEEAEQGTIQAALRAVYMLSCTLGSVTFGAVFRAFAKDNAMQQLNHTFFLINIVCGAFQLAMILSLHQHMKNLAGTNYFWAPSLESEERRAEEKRR